MKMDTHFKKRDKRMQNGTNYLNEKVDEQDYRWVVRVKKGMILCLKLYLDLRENS